MLIERTEPDVHPPADRVRGRILVVFVVAVVWGLMTHGTFAGSGDEPHYLMIAHSLAFDADLDLTNDYRDATLIGGGTLEPEAHALQRDGRLRPVHDIGMPLAFAPVVRVAYVLAERLGDMLPSTALAAARLNKPLLLRHQLSLVMALLTGLLARELFLMFRAMGASSRSAFAWGLLFVVTPPIVSHAFLFFTEIPTALITFFVFRRLTLGLTKTVGAAVLVGAFTGFLMLVHARNIGIAVGLTLVSMLTLRRRPGATKLLAVFLLAIALAGLGRTLTTYLLWGTLVTTPHAAFGVSASAGASLREMYVRGTGLLFDREYGLIAYGPLYLLAGPGLLVLARQRRLLLRDLLVVVACYMVPVLLPVTNLHGWTGGWSPAARFLVPISPLLCVAVFAYAARASRRGQLAVIILVAIQLAIDAYIWQFPKTLWNDGDGLSAFRYSQWLPSWTNPHAAFAFAVALCALCAFAFLCFRGVGHTTDWDSMSTTDSRPTP